MATATLCANALHWIALSVLNYLQQGPSLRGRLHDLALPGCNEACDRFDVLKIEISYCTCLSKIIS